MWEPHEPFFPARLKLERADKHIAELHRQIIAFHLLRPYRVIAQEDPKNPALLIWVAKIVKDINTTRFPVIIGDAVHNLTSALDIAMCAIVKKRGRGVAGVYFPAADSIERFEETMQDGLENKVGPDIAYVLRTVIQPYPSGKSASLNGLRKLSNMDKHRLLTPVAHNIAIHTFNRLGQKHRPIGLGKSVYGPYKDGAPLLSTPKVFPNGTSFEVNDELEAYFEVSFEKGGPFEFRDVIATLRSISSDITRAIFALWPHV